MGFGGLGGGAIAGIVIIAILGTIILLITAFKCIRGRKYRARTLEGLQEEHQRLLDERERRLDIEVQKRRSEESDTMPGSHVWFSRYIHHGSLKHWVLIIDDTKYELRRNISTGKYVYNIAEWSIDQEKREAALAERKIPDVDGYYVCLIGWTRLAADELRDTCEQVLRQFGSYNLLWNNCQDFLQRFADRIISRKALDWSWFRENTKTEYQDSQKLPPPPEAIIAANQSAMVQQQQQQQNNIQNQQMIQNNINQMNSQIAMQNTQLTAINNQMMLQNNMMMNPGMGIGMGGGGA